MKNKILLFCACMFLAIGASHAQSFILKTTIPFNFVIGNQTLPSGDYTIRPVTQDGKSILLRSADLKTSVLISPRRCGSGSFKPKSELLFKVVEGRYYLWQIWTAEYDQGQELAVNPIPTQQARSSPKRTVAVKVTSAKA